MKVIIKELDRKDFDKVIAFAIDGMNFNRYVDNKLVLRLYGRYFLYLELERATQVLAAYMDNRLVGVLMAVIKDRPKRHSSLWRRFYIKTVEAVMSVVVKGGHDIYDVANKAILEEYMIKAAPDGEICFLVADPTMQGKGIGTQLLDELSRRDKGKLVYLYTDDNCTYQFYEHKGFERVVEEHIQMELGAKTVPLTCLLYSKLL